MSEPTTDEPTFFVGGLTAHEMQLLIMGLQANARNLQQYGLEAKIPQASIDYQNRASHLLESRLRAMLPKNARV